VRSSLRSGDPGEVRLGLLRLIAYVVPSISFAALGMPIVVHLPQFYASQEIGLSLVVTGTVFSFLRLLDVGIDPVVGYLSDRWRTRFGRRRPMIALGAPILAVGIWMVFVPGGPASVTYLCFWLFVMYLGWSMTVIPHLSWGAELTPDYHERSRIYGWSQAAVIFGMVGVLVAPAFLEAGGKASQALQVWSMAIFALGALVPSIALCIGVLPEPEVKLGTHAGLIPTLKFLLKDPAIRRVMAVDLIESTSQGARGAMFLFFTRIALGLSTSGGTLLLAYFAFGFLCIPLWIALARRIGKHRALYWSYLYTFATSPLLFLIPYANFPVALAIIALNGVNYGAPAFLLRAMMADIADADTVRNKSERAGLMYSFLSLTSKFGLGWSVGIAFGVLAWIGFDPKIVNAPAAIENFRLFYISLPVICGVLNLAVMHGYPLDQAHQQQLREEIARLREGHHSAEDIMPSMLVPGGAALASDSEAVTHVHDTASEHTRL